MIDYHKIDQLKKRLDSYRPLATEIEKNLHEDLLVRWTYHSNAIEGNTLTLKETKVVLEGIAIGGKFIREHLEVINHRDAIIYMENLLAKQESLNSQQICSTHHLLLKSIDSKNAGVYRNINVIVAGAKHVPPDFQQIEDKMQDFMDWYCTKAQTLHPIERAARIHADFVGIHPFVDGNGRTSRLLMNFELIKDGYPPAVLSVEKKHIYYETLDQVHVDQNYTPFIELMAECVKQSFDPYWHALGIAEDQERFTDTSHNL